MDMPHSFSSLSARVEALLFAEGSAMTKRRLAQLAQCTSDDLGEALRLLRERQTGGIALIETETEAALAVHPTTADIVRQAQESELSREIGDAGLEVLAVVLYRGPSTRAQIDYIRGVNTSSTIRTLLSRGLLERAGNPEDAREYLYRPTAELLAHLGVTQAQALPEYARIASELAAFEKKEEQPFVHDHGTAPAGTAE